MSFIKLLESNIQSYLKLMNRYPHSQQVQYNNDVSN